MSICIFLKKNPMSKKILFWFSSDFTQFLIASKINQFVDSESYAIIDVPDKAKNFFNTQKIVNLKKFWFFHDNISSKNTPDLEYLKNFEKKYKIDLWKLAINERTFYRFFNFHNFSQNEVLSILETECRFFESILNEIKPDHIIMKEPGFQHLEVFYQMCKNLGEKILIVTYPNFGYKCLISSTPQTFDDLHSLENVSGKFKTLENLISYKNSFDYNKQVLTANLDWNLKPVNILKAGLKFLFQSNTNINSHYTYYGRTKISVVLYMLKNYFLRFYRGNFLNKKSLKNVSLDSNFLYFPLSLDMERNLLITAPLTNNQLEIIRNISKLLPINFKLMVKEHPDQISRDWRSVEEYNDIMTLPNVEFVHPKFPPKELIKKCSAIIGIGGTTGLEASFFGKPTILFSKVGYSILPWVFQVSDINQLPKIIDEAINTKVNIDYLDRYLTYLDENTFDFDLFKLHSDIKDVLYLGGQLIDNEINPTLLEQLIKSHETNIIKLTKEHVKKF